MGCLRRLADAGHTVLAVIHQPSRDIFNSFHLVLVIFAGRVLYYGPPQFSYAYFGSRDSHPEDLFEVLERYESETHGDPQRQQELVRQLADRFAQSPECREYVTSRISRAPAAQECE